MKETKRLINAIQDDLRGLNMVLGKRGVHVEGLLQEMIETLSYISGYVDKSFEKAEQEI